MLTMDKSDDPSCKSQRLKEMNGLSTSSHFNPPDEEGQRKGGRPWDSTFVRVGPLSGIGAMFLAIALLAVDAAVLVASNGASENSWPAGPNVYLAVCAAVANLAVRYACLQGVIVAWWSRAMHGSTVADLHQTWRAGSSLFGAIASGRNIGLLGTATIFSTLITVDGPLLQRSTTVHSVPFHHDHQVSLEVSMVPEIPHGLGGWWTTGAHIGDNSPNSPVFNESIPAGDGKTVSNNVYSNTRNNLELNRLWAMDGPLDIVTGCVDKCRATISEDTKSTLRVLGITNIAQEHLR